MEIFTYAWGHLSNMTFILLFDRFLLWRESISRTAAFGFSGTNRKCEHTRLNTPWKTPSSQEGAVICPVSPSSPAQSASQPSNNAESFKTGMLTWRRSVGSSRGTSARARQRALLSECAPAAWHSAEWCKSRKNAFQRVHETLVLEGGVLASSFPVWKWQLEHLTR